MHVVVQVPAYREPGLRATLETLESQAVAPHRVDVEAWVTPCQGATEAAARSAAGVDVHLVEGGKLTVRNRAHDDALARDADAIVQCDADVEPATPFALANLVAPLEAGTVVASNGRPRKQPSVLGALVEVAARAEDRLRPHLHGQFSAVTTDAWEQAGPFDETIDQRAIDAVRREEEFAFYERLTSLGEVAEPEGAVVVEDLRRHRCTVGQAFAWSGRPHSAEWCERRGTETFHPRE